MENPHKLQPRTSLLIRRLSTLCQLSDGEQQALLGKLSPPRILRKGEEIVSDGLTVHVLASGMACRYRVLGSGQRQIASLLLPGDIVDFYSPVIDTLGDSVSTLTSCEIVSIRIDRLRALVEATPNLGTALWRYCLSQCAILQSWLINLRRRNAAERLAHLFCEQFVRLKSVGLAESGRPFRFPVGQADLADATAMSSVHVNRTLQCLRKQHLIGIDAEQVEILDWGALQELADFDPTYLHLREAGTALRTARSAA